MIRSRDAELTSPVEILTRDARLHGELTMLQSARGCVLVPNGRNASRSTTTVARSALHRAGIATLSFELMTPDEEKLDQQNHSFSLDIKLLAGRLVDGARALQRLPVTRSLPLGYLASGTEAAACLVAAAQMPDPIRAIVAWEGRPELATPILFMVRAPTLLITDATDVGNLVHQREALSQLKSSQLIQLDAATDASADHERALGHLTHLTQQWFSSHFAPKAARRAETSRVAAQGQ